jgi:hypothetical protein
LEQFADLFTKLIFTLFQITFIGKGEIRPTSEAFKIDKLRPRGFLKKFDIDYALNLAVPPTFEDEFVGGKLDCLGNLVDKIKSSLSILVSEELTKTVQAPCNCGPVLTQFCSAAHVATLPGI